MWVVMCSNSNKMCIQKKAWGGQKPPEKHLVGFGRADSPPPPERWTGAKMHRLIHEFPSRSYSLSPYMILHGRKMYLV